LPSFDSEQGIGNRRDIPALQTSDHTDCKLSDAARRTKQACQQGHPAVQTDDRTRLAAGIVVGSETPAALDVILGPSK